MDTNIQNLLDKLTPEQLSQLEARLLPARLVPATIDVIEQYYCKSCKTTFERTKNVYKSTYSNLGHPYTVSSCSHCIEVFSTNYTKEQLAQMIYNLLTYGKL